MRWLGRRLAVALSVGVMLGGAPLLKGATLTVSSLADSGAGSLRQTILNASAGDTISITVQGTITLSGGKLVIDKNLQIGGPGSALLRVDAGKASAAFVVLTNVTASITDLAIVNGLSTDTNSAVALHPVGGGVQNYGNLTMTRCLVTGCDATDGAGGGIFSLNLLTLRQCTLSTNTATLGGGICDYGTGQLLVDSCTINGNATSGRYGDDAGGILKNAGALLMTNSTVSGNSSHDGVGGIDVGGSVVLDSSTVVSNRSSLLVGGVAASSPIACRNTIIADNYSGGLGQGWDVSGTILSGGYNLIQDTNGCLLTGTQTGNVYGVNPMLGPLQSNGGPTLTHALLTGSPAIDHGSSGGLATDQRGYSRIYDVTGIQNIGDGADIGAFEFGASVPAPPPAPPPGGWTPLSLGSSLVAWFEPTNTYTDVAGTIKASVGQNPKSIRNLSPYSPSTWRILTNSDVEGINSPNGNSADGGVTHIHPYNVWATQPYLNTNTAHGEPTLFFRGNANGGDDFPAGYHTHGTCYLWTGTNNFETLMPPFTFYYVGVGWAPSLNMTGFGLTGAVPQNYNGVGRTNCCFGPQNGGWYWIEGSMQYIFSYESGVPTVEPSGGMHLHLWKVTWWPDKAATVWVDGVNTMAYMAYHGTEGGEAVWPGGDAYMGKDIGLNGLVLGDYGRDVVQLGYQGHGASGDIGTVIILNKVPSAAENTSITNWLHQHYVLP